MYGLFFGGEGDEGDEHFFHGDAAVLEGVVVVLHVVVVVVGVGEEVASRCEDVCARHVEQRQSEAFGLLDFVHLAWVVTEVLAHFVAQVGVGVFVANHLDGVVHSCGAVVGGEHDFPAMLGYALEDFQHITVFKPCDGE